MLKDNLLKLNIQYFAEEEEVEEDTNTQDESSKGNIEADSSDETENTEEQDAGNKIPYDRFKSKVDEVNALKKKVADFEKAQEDATKKELEDKEEYKTLYQQAIDEIETMKTSALTAKKEAQLSKAGYNYEQVAKLAKLVEGESDEDINSSIDTLKETFPIQPNYVDPSVDNSFRQTPKKKDNHDLGRSLFDRIKGK